MNTVRQETRRPTQAADTHSEATDFSPAGMDPSLGEEPYALESEWVEEDVETQEWVGEDMGTEEVAEKDRVPIDTGSKGWRDFQLDKYQYDDFPSFPNTSTAGSTFYARQADNPYKYNWFWCLQHDRGHTYEGWDRRVRQEDVFKYNEARIVLSRAEVCEVTRDEALRMVMRENLNGFSRYYEGVRGAALGFAALSRFDELEAAKNSYIVQVAEQELDIDGERLVEYVWQKYEGDE